MNSEQEAYLRFKERGFLSTVSKEGVPSVVPVCFVYKDGKIYTPVDRKPKTTENLARLKNIESTGEVAFLVDSYSENWERLSYILVHGTASVLSDGEETEEVRRLLLMKYPQYRTLRLDGPIIAIRVKSAKFWSFT